MWVAKFFHSLQPETRLRMAGDGGGSSGPGLIRTLCGLYRLRIFLLLSKTSDKAHPMLIIKDEMTILAFTVWPLPNWYPIFTSAKSA